MSTRCNIVLGLIIDWVKSTLNKTQWSSWRHLNIGSLFDNIKNIIINFGGEGTWINFKESYNGYF